MGFVGRRRWKKGWWGGRIGSVAEMVRWVGGYRPVVVSASMTTGRWGHCFARIHTHREKHMCVGAHSSACSSDVIRVRVISSASLLIVQTKMPKTNGSYLIIWVKDEPQWGIADGQFVTIFLCLVSPFFLLNLTIIDHICKHWWNVFIHI